MADINKLKNEIVELGLDPQEFTGAIDSLTGFILGLGGDDYTDIYEEDRELMTVQCDDNGGIQALYSGAIMRREKEDESLEVVIKLGSHIFSCQEVSEGSFTGLKCGRFNGTLKTVESEGIGGEKKKTLFVSWREYGGKVTYEIPVIAEKGETLVEAELLAAMESGTSIAPFLRSMPNGGGGNYITMNDLEIGEYRIVEITEGEPHPEHGRSFRIVLTHGISFFSKGKKFVNSLCANIKLYQAALKLGKPLTLTITEKRELAQGIALNAAIVMREPKVDMLAPAQVSVASIAPAAEPAPKKAKTKQLVGAAVGEAQLDALDDIPF